jgi:hypothetical protein
LRAKKRLQVCIDADHAQPCTGPGDAPTPPVTANVQNWRRAEGGRKPRDRIVAVQRRPSEQIAAGRDNHGLDEGVDGGFVEDSRRGDLLPILGAQMFIALVRRARRRRHHARNAADDRIAIHAVFGRQLRTLNAQTLTGNRTAQSIQQDGVDRLFFWHHVKIRSIETFGTHATCGADSLKGSETMIYTDCGG